MMKEDGSDFDEVLKKLKKNNPKIKDFNLIQKDVVIDLGDDVNVPEKLRPQEIIEFDQLEKLKRRVEKTDAEIAREKARAAAEQKRRLFEMKRKDLLRKNIYLVGKGDHLWKIIKTYKPEWYSENVDQKKVIFAKIKELNPNIKKLSELKEGMELRLGKERDFKATKTYIVKKDDKFWDIVTKEMPDWSVKSLKERRAIYNKMKLMNPNVPRFSELMPGTELVFKVEHKQLRDEHNLYTVKENGEKFYDIVKFKRPFEMLGTEESRSRYYNKIKGLNPKIGSFSNLKKDQEIRFDPYVSPHHRTSYLRAGWGMTAFNISQTGAFGNASGSVVFANRLNIMNHLEKKEWTFDIEIDRFSYTVDGYPTPLETSSFQFLVGYKPFSRMRLWDGQVNFLLGMDTNKTPILKLTTLGNKDTHINTKYLVLGIRWDNSDWFLPGNLLKHFPNYYTAHKKDWRDYKLKKDENVLGYGVRQLTENVDWFTKFIKTFHQRAFIGLKLGIGGDVEEGAVKVKEQSAMALQLEYAIHRKLYDAKNFEVSLEFLGRYNYRNFSLNAQWDLENGVSDITSHDINGMVAINLHYDFLGDFLDKVQGGILGVLETGVKKSYKIIKDVNPLIDKK